MVCKEPEDLDHQPTGLRLNHSLPAQYPQSFTVDKISACVQTTAGQSDITSLELAINNICEPYLDTFHVGVRRGSLVMRVLLPRVHEMGLTLQFASDL